MEGLVGPLSPLNADFSGGGARSGAAVHELAADIADICCAAITAPRGRVTRLIRPAESSKRRTL
jgi:hypothetical protein